MNYEITEEQIKELAKSNDKVKKWFPEVFETKLEVGKWYKSQTGLFCVTEINEEVVSAYGFEYENWKEKGSFNIKYAKHDYLASDSEIEKALINEAKKRGFKEGVYVDNSNICELGSIYLIEKGSSFEFLPNNLLTYGNNLVVIFNKGKWAEIVKTYTKEEAEKLLNAKII